MSWLTEELLRTGGIVLVVGAGIGWIIFMLLCRLREAAVRSQLTKEYGEFPDTEKKV